jgi:hypothetical protein
MTGHFFFAERTRRGPWCMVIRRTSRGTESVEIDFVSSFPLAERLASNANIMLAKYEAWEKGAQ